ncbi:response regulator [Aureimonas leprariae]|uniref:Response regulator n=1 Tax=Plantimonas leprariae TaxID=2615207 RepID=A0A7V7PP69_9HYPH|nr:response regulator [Aureimonas leprariae]KAB0679741.1 response regulator [Aureimonas leprariae]
MTISGDLGELVGKNVLVVEDEYFLATEMAEAVRQAGGTALGPVPDVEGAMAIIAAARVDAAVLDIRLGDETSFPVAAALKAKGVRVVFVTGYDDWFLPNELDDVPVYRKPADPDNVVRILLEPKPGDKA